MTASFASLIAGTTSPGLFSWRGSADRDLVGEAAAAGWTTLGLDTRGVGSVTDFYDVVAATWHLPAWFGRNLDALFDVLAELTAQPTMLVWVGLRELADVDPVQTEALVDLLRDVSGQAPAFAVIVCEDRELNGFDGLL